jgi:hypothetical protein
MMAYLAHEDCPVTGEIYGAGGGRFTRLFIAENPGYVHDQAGTPTAEDVAANWDQINDVTGFYIPASLADWSAHFLSHHSPAQQREV